jgi:hypothetical protein
MIEAIEARRGCARLIALNEVIALSHFRVHDFSWRGAIER